MCLRVYLKSQKKFITEILNKVHVGQLWQNQISYPLREWHFGVGQPRPMIRVSSPRIGMFKGEGQTIVNCGHINFWQRIHILKKYKCLPNYVQSNLVIRSFLVSLKLFLNAKCTLSLWSKWQIGHGKLFLNTNLFLITKFDCSRILSRLVWNCPNWFKLV